LDKVDQQQPIAQLVVNHPLAHVRPQALVNQSLPTLNVAAAVDKPAPAPDLGTAVAQADDGAYRIDIITL